MVKQNCLNGIGLFLYGVLLGLQGYDLALFFQEDYQKLVFYFEKPDYIVNTRKNSQYLFLKDQDFYDRYECVRDHQCMALDDLSDSDISSIRSSVNRKWSDYIIMGEIPIYFVSAFVVKMMKIGAYIYSCSENGDEMDNLIFVGILMTLEAFEFAFASFPIANYHIFVVTYECCIETQGLEPRILIFQLIAFFLRLLSIVFMIIMKCGYLQYKRDYLCKLFWKLFSIKLCDEGCCSNTYFWRWSGCIIQFILGGVLAFMAIYCISYFYDKLSIYGYIQVGIVAIEIIFNIIEFFNERYWDSSRNYQSN